MLVMKWMKNFGTRLPHRHCRSFIHMDSVVYSQNHYDVLGVSKSATPAEIKKAYFKLCKEYHPDIYPNDKSKLKHFLKINDAYTVLSNAETKRQYDAIGKRPSMHSDNFHEHYSSAYRGNPYARQHRSRANTDWDRFYSHRRSNFNRYERWRPKDELDRYWDEFYRQRNANESWRRASNSAPTWFLADRITSIVIALVVTLLLMRLIAAGMAINSRTAMQERELQRHLEVKRRAEEARQKFQDNSNLSNPDTIHSKVLEEA